MRTRCSLPNAAHINRNDLHERFAVDDGAFIRVEFLSNFKAVVKQLGGDAGSLLANVGIDESSPRSDCTRVSLRAMAELMERSALKLNCPDFGMRLAELQDLPAIMNPLESLIRNAPTVGAAMDASVCHMAAYSSGIRASLEHEEARHMRFFAIEVLLGGFSAPIQMIEHLMLLTYNTVAFLSGGAAQAREVRFSHVRAGRKGDYAKRFGCAIKFGQPYDGLSLSEADFNSKVIDGNCSVFEAESRRVAAEFPAHPPGLEVRVRLAIGRALAESLCTREQVAKLLGMHSRTLQRRLSGLGMRFEVIRDDVRRQLAVRYLARSDIKLVDVGGRLGYSEPAVLSRSCRRWFAATPSELRRTLLRSNSTLSA
jgi:AraC-like DNA-binding protein